MYETHKVDAGRSTETTTATTLEPALYLRVLERVGDARQREQIRLTEKHVNLLLSGRQASESVRMFLVFRFFSVFKCELA